MFALLARLSPRLARAGGALGRALLAPRCLVDVMRQFYQMLHGAPRLLFCQAIPVFVEPVARVDDAPCRLVHGI